MPDINIKRFVDIDIETNVFRSLTGTRDTMVLFTPEGSAGTANIYSSLAEASNHFSPESSFTTTLAYLSVFFNNGGVKVKVIEGKSYDALTVSDIAEVNNEYIIIACAIPDSNREAGYGAMKQLAITRNVDSTIYGINEKIILARSTTNNDTTSVKNFAVKHSGTLGAEMTIAAYLTQIDVYKANTVHDYYFTNETISAEQLSDSNFATLMTNNYNVVVNLANSKRNCGGNCKDGEELTNNFVRIVLHQTLTDKLLNLLVQKIKNSSGIAQIYSTIAQELEEYKNCGYLSTDKVWTENDLTISYNQQNYTIIEKGTALVNGYAIKVLPIYSLTQSDKAAHKAPPIYVILADQYGIRQITINGEVI